MKRSDEVHQKKEKKKGQKQYSSKELSNEV